MKWRGRNVLITGASSGIGAALARRLAERGAAVGLVARRRDRLERLVLQINGSTERGRAVLAVADVAVEGSIERAVADVRGKLGGIDCVVANAGYDAFGELEALTIEDYRRQLETNVFGVLRTIYATLADIKRSRGVIVIVGSVSGHLSPPGHSAYNMSKHALRALAEALRAELRVHGVGVVLASPGFVATEIRTVDGRGVVNPDRPDPVPAWLCMSPDRVARGLERALSTRRAEVAIGAAARLTLLLSRLAPGLSRLLMRLTAASIQRRVAAPK